MKIIKKWFSKHKSITHAEHLRDIIGIIVLLTIIYGYVTIKYSTILRVKHETKVIAILEGRKTVVLDALSDYYTGNESEIFERARYYNDVRDNVYVAINAINRFFPIVFDGDYPFDLYDILAIIMTESSFNPDAISSKKALGIMQIMDPRLHIKEIDGIRDPHDINCSVYGGLLCLKQKYNYTKDKKKAIIAYNGIVKRKDGTWKEGYYNKVMENKGMILKKLEVKK